MFDHKRGLGPGKWLWWFMGVMVVYALLYMFPATEPIAARLGQLIFFVAIVLIVWRVLRVIAGAFRKG